MSHGIISHVATENNVERELEWQTVIRVVIERKSANNVKQLTDNY